MKVAAIIVSYNGLNNNWINKCLESLYDSNTAIDCYVIDNASKDGTVESIKKNFPNVNLTVSESNLGFAKANNIGIRKAIDAGTDYVVLINQDVWVEKDSISNLIKISEHNQGFGILSPVHLNGIGTNLDFNFTNYISKPEFEGRNMMFDFFRKKELKKIYSIDFVNAAFWLLPKATIEKLGYFDDVLFTHYGEDSNFCQRLLFNKMQIGLVPNVFIFHDREERKGKKKNNVFNMDEILKRFILKGSNPLDLKADSFMDKQIKYYFRNYVKAMFQLKFTLAKKHKSLHDQMISYRGVIKERKSNY